MRRHEDLEWSLLCFGAERIQETRDTVRLEPDLDFIDQKHRRLSSRMSLEARHQQAH